MERFTLWLFFIVASSLLIGLAVYFVGTTVATASSNELCLNPAEWSQYGRTLAAAVWAVFSVIVAVIWTFICLDDAI